MIPGPLRARPGPPWARIEGGAAGFLARIMGGLAGVGLRIELYVPGRLGLDLVGLFWEDSPNEPEPLAL